MERVNMRLTKEQIRYKKKHITNGWETLMLRTVLAETAEILSLGAFLTLIAMLSHAVGAA